MARFEPRPVTEEDFHKDTNDAASSATCFAGYAKKNKLDLSKLQDMLAKPDDLFDFDSSPRDGVK
ncbi:hypothetical protein B0A50_04385 [Salinomyces thailandicus]|uniref:Uncharacterized protein n=1 Tax=Salinomyces thailandicus TaxID=706561 RepID=A0A4U0TYU1_9PEZI|nr:hypothetical protein B0A50_04385 [Salinomyces thailandica]